MDGNLVKDVVAIALGSFLGASLAHSFGQMWAVGVFFGGAVGYLVRLFTEPRRIAWAARAAWWRTIGWRPKHGWQERSKIALQFAVALGGCCGVMLLFVLWLVAARDPSYAAMFISPGGFLFAYGVAMGPFTILWGLVFLALGLPPVDRSTGAYVFMSPNMPIGRAAWLLNPVVIPFTIVVYVVSCIVKGLMVAVRSSPDVVRTVGMFLKTFLVLVHSNDFTACGTYALVGGVIIFLYVSPAISGTLPAAVVCGAAGALMRRVVVRVLNVETA